MTPQENDVVELTNAPIVYPAPSTMVVLGSFGLPRIIELQARVIRKNCGNIPILVSDDYTADAYPDRFEQLKQICKDMNLHLRMSNLKERIGHSGGDMGAFYNGLLFAKENGIKVCAKLSQRYIIDIPQWIQLASKSMSDLSIKSGGSIGKFSGKFIYRLRTECVIMDVAAWTRPSVLSILEPRVIGATAEGKGFQALMEAGGANMFTPRWMKLGDKKEKFQDVYWHDSDDDESYMSLARKYGMNSTVEEMYSGPSQQLANYKIG